MNRWELKSCALLSKLNEASAKALRYISKGYILTNAKDIEKLASLVDDAQNLVYELSDMEKEK